MSRWLYSLLILTVALPGMPMGPCCCVALGGESSDGCPTLFPSAAADPIPETQSSESKASCCQRRKLEEESSAASFGISGQLQHRCECGLIDPMAPRNRARDPQQSRGPEVSDSIVAPTVVSINDTTHPFPRVQQIRPPNGQTRGLQILYCCWLA